MKLLQLCIALLGLTGLAAAQTLERTVTSKQIVIVLDEQYLYAVSRDFTTRSHTVDRLIVNDVVGDRLTIDYSFHCSTGRSGLETPVGKVPIQKKKKDAVSLWGGSMPYALQIYMYDPKMGKTRRLNIHEFDSVPNYPASHGCVRMIPGEGRKVFAWADVGTPVLIVAHRPDWLPKT